MLQPEETTENNILPKKKKNTEKQSKSRENERLWNKIKIDKTLLAPSLSCSSNTMRKFGKQNTKSRRTNLSCRQP